MKYINSPFMICNSQRRNFYHFASKCMSYLPAEEKLIAEIEREKRLFKNREDGE